MSVKTATSLQSARKEFTRSRICEAAKSVFLEHGYAGSTIEQIAQAAGTRRSTVYFHFKDKDDILGAIIDDYLGYVRDLIMTLPGPQPTKTQVETWISDFADMAREQKAPTILLLQGSSVTNIPAPVLRFGPEMIAAFSERHPAFSVIGKSGDDLVRARAYTVIRELGWALAYAVQDLEVAKSQLKVAAELLHRFITTRSL